MGILVVASLSSLVEFGVQPRAGKNRISLNRHGNGRQQHYAPNGIREQPVSVDDANVFKKRRNTGSLEPGLRNLSLEG